MGLFVFCFVYRTESGIQSTFFSFFSYLLLGLIIKHSQVSLQTHCPPETPRVMTCYKAVSTEVRHKLD